ncbi:MAG: DUF86 domain-containing protein [Cyclobacteriaceae bacterium]|nr:DUF86 domain-containing protein [Cyclobacteriaceae bacterium]
MSEKDLANLEAIIDSIKKIIRFTSKFDNPDSFYDDEQAFDAVLMNFVIIGETVSKLSLPLRKETKQVPWTKIKAFRNIIAHNYFGVDAEEVWQIINDQLPALKVEITKIIKKRN